MNSTGTYRLILDHLGSVRLVVNTQSGEIAQHMDYDAFGNVTQDTRPGFQPFGFAGGLFDALTGLVRFGARDYDSMTGRWGTKESIIIYRRTSNLYTYVENDPANWNDFNGERKSASKSGGRKRNPSKKRSSANGNINPDIDLKGNIDIDGKFKGFCFGYCPNPPPDSVCIGYCPRDPPKSCPNS